MNNLSFKLLSTILFSILVLLGLLLFIILDSSEDIIHKEIEKVTMAQLHSVEERIRHYKDNITQASEIISKDIGIQRALDTQNSRGINKKLNDLSKTFPYFHYIILSELNFDIFAVSTKKPMGQKYLGEELLGLNIQKHPLFVQPYQLDVVSSQVDLDPYLDIIEVDASEAQWHITPVTTQGKTIGWLVCSFNWKKEISLLSNDIINNLHHNNIPIKHVSILKGSVEEPKQDNNKELIIHKTLSWKNVPYTLVIEFDKQTIFAPLHELEQKMIITMTIFLISFLFILYVPIQKFILSKLTIISKASSEYSKGNLDHRIKKMSPDELGLLSLTMNQMAQSLQENIKRVQHAKDHLEHKVQERTHELQQSNHDLDEFAYIASHDLKGPIRSIGTYANFLLEDYRDQLDGEGTDYIDSIQRLTKQASDLLSDLLNYSRVGRAELAIQETNLNDVVEEVIDSIKPMIKERNVQIQTPKTLPNIQCDQTRIREVYRNLIENAIKYNDKNEKIVEVSYIEDSSKPNSAIFTVKDNGIGIREEHLSEVFKIFKRLHNHDEYDGGSGSGLTLTQKMLRRHGGEIWVESEFGVGSTFKFIIGNEIRKII